MLLRYSWPAGDRLAREPVQMALLRLLERVVRLFTKAGIRRWDWALPLWGWFARYFIGNTAVVKVEGLTLVVPTSDGFGFNLLARGSWEPFQMKLFKRSISPGMTMIDVGAHIGLYALVASRIVGPEGKVYAFEPEPENYSLLQKNIKLNGLTNVVPVCKAVSDQLGTVMLYVDLRQSTHHSMGRRSGKVKGIACEAVSLDDFVAGQKVDVVKMDVEGAEMGVLRGMQRIISENPEIKLLCEFAPDWLIKMGTEPRDFLAKLVVYGFEIYRIEELREKIIYVADVSRLSSEEGCYLFCSRVRIASPFV